MAGRGKRQQTDQKKDYGCPCGKTYFSYAAVYTHIRNKHNNQRSFMEGIVRPTWKKTPKGRPKENNKKFLNSEIERMNVLENGLLDLFQILEDSNLSDAFLRGDQQVDFHEVETEAQIKYLNFKKSTRSIFEQEGGELGINSLQDTYLIFFKQFSKHLKAEVSAKILTSLLCFSGQYSEEREEDFSTRIWGEGSEIFALIKKVFWEWNAVGQFSDVKASNTCNKVAEKELERQ